jgi:hypothetical protein
MVSEEADLGKFGLWRGLIDGVRSPDPLVTVGYTVSLGRSTS